MRGKRRIGALLLAAALTAGLFPAYAADDTVVEIATAEQLCAFSQSCTLDAWSQGKTVVLTADIDLTGVDFAPIPTFGGVFEGGGHTISGLSLTHSGSQQGLFRYVQEGAAVRDLNVSGRVEPGGSASAVGGIAGCNRGTLSNCAFQGSVTGKTNVGGIAGTNEGTGEIVSCTVQGNISGSHYTGGVMGQNLGAAVSCVNRAQVNTRGDEVTISLEEWNWEDVNSTENVSAHTDTGGIAGYSIGILQSCDNYGAIGYPHAGYNVGGIVGRQAGFLDGCRNYGAVYGRKDVAGVAGQLEPYLLLQFDEDSLQKLDGELDGLRSLLRQLGNEASGAGDLFAIHADALAERLETVRSGAQDIAGWTVDYGNGMSDTVNELSARVTRTLDRLSPVLDDLAGSSDGLGNAFRKVGRVFRDLDAASVWGEDAADEIQTAFERMGGAMDDAQEAAAQIADAVQALLGSPGSAAARAEAQAGLEAGMAALQQALTQAAGSSDALAGQLRALDVQGGLPGALEGLAEALRQSAAAWDQMTGGVIGLLPGIGGGAGDLSGVLTDLASLRERVSQSLTLLRQGLGSVAASIDGLRRAAGSVADAFDSLQSFSDDMDGSLGRMAEAFSALEDAMDGMGSAARGMEDLTDELAGEPTLTFPALDSGYTAAVDSVFGALEEIADEVSGLRVDLSGSGDRLHSTADAVNDQLGVINDLLMEGYSEALEPDDAGERMEDVSDAEDGGTQGRITRAANYGVIEGDLDVGGIAGSMAIEYDLDPEDDIMSAGRRSLNFSYQTRAVVTDCRNEGEIVAKKNNAGGIVGRMDLGRISGCEGYGVVASTSGAYVGGIAGASSSIIRDSWVKCRLTGEDYVGGIAGLAGDVSGCRALADIDADGECIGAIAGDADGELIGNVFVAGPLGAVDGVSYAGKAEPVEYDELLTEAALPAEFQSFTVTFLVDGEVLATESAAFGESLPEIPAVPAREGQFGEWSDSDFTALRADKTVEAVYSPYITVLESGLDEGGRPRLLAEGKFDRQASLVLTAAEGAPGDAPGEPLRAVLAPGEEAASGGLLLRALAADGENAVWLAENGRWRKVDSIRDGSYLVFAVDGAEAVYCVGRETSLFLTLLLAAGIAGLALLGFLRRRNRRVRRKPARAAAPAAAVAAKR